MTSLKSFHWNDFRALRQGAPPMTSLKSFHWNDFRALRHPFPDSASATFAVSNSG
jgi:hypothetical protein